MHPDNDAPYSMLLGSNTDLSERPSGGDDEPTGASDDQSADDQSTEESSDQPADDQSTGESSDQPADDQSTGQSDDSAKSDGDQEGIEIEDKATDGGDQGAQPAEEESALAPAPARPYGVESWRPLVTEMADDIPVEVLLRWIKHESGGNPCSTGKIVNGASIENGLFQLYSPDDDHIATPAQLHGSFCTGQKCIRDLTLQEARIQVASGIAYVRICRERARAQLKQGGVSWDETGSDFWSLVKMQHNLPSVPKTYIPKLRPSSWSDFKAGVLKEHPQYGTSSIFSNAEDIGAAAG
jgi:hypothetical protein